MWDEIFSRQPIKGTIEGVNFDMDGDLCWTEDGHFRVLEPEKVRKAIGVDDSDWDLVMVDGETGDEYAWLVYHEDYR